MIIHYNCTIFRFLLHYFLLIYHPYPPSLIFCIVQAVNLYRDPTGDNIFSGTDPSKRTERSQIKESHNDRAAGMSELTDAEKVTLLNSQVARLQESVSEVKQTISQKNKRISELEAILESAT